MREDDIAQARMELEAAREAFARDLENATPGQRIQMLGEYPILFAELEEQVAGQEEQVQASPAAEELSGEDLVKYLVNVSRHARRQEAKIEDRSSEPQTPRASTGRRRLREGS